MRSAYPRWDLLPTIHELSKSQTELPSSLDGGSLTNLFENGDVGSVSRSGEGFVFIIPVILQLH